MHHMMELNSFVINLLDMNGYICYLCQGGFVTTSVCLIDYLLAKQLQKLWRDFHEIFRKRWYWAILKEAGGLF